MLLITERSKIDWGTYASFLPDFVCRCAVKSREKEHMYFSISFYGECWGLMSDIATAKSRGESSECKNALYDPCGESDIICTGTSLNHFVYENIGKLMCALNLSILICAQFIECTIQ